MAVWVGVGDRDLLGGHPWMFAGFGLRLALYGVLLRVASYSALPWVASYSALLRVGRCCVLISGY